MSDALPLPPRPNLDQYRKLAKDFQAACNSSEPAAVRSWAARWVETLTLLKGEPRTAELQRRILSDVARVQRVWRSLPISRDQQPHCTLALAQFFIARCHGFASWPKFSKHVREAARQNTPVSQFESAADAIISGDARTLHQLLHENPELVRMRSTRDHRSTLLHYVSANGIEDFRQKTPKNIVEITNVLLDAGAAVNAESDAYGGRSTTLGLAATSCHPELAGVQLPLLQLLIERGALIDGPDGSSVVNACLHNGRGQAAEFLSNCGARLDLEGAAGVGRLDIVEAFVSESGTVRPPATPHQLINGFAWACQFGRTEVVDLLLRRGIDVNAKLPHSGQTGLHWAAWNGHAAIVKLLLDGGANVHTRDDTHNGTPLEWAVYHWSNSAETRGARFYDSIALLAQAGAALDPAWFDVDDEDRRRAIRKLGADENMQAALRGQIPH